MSLFPSNVGSNGNGGETVLITFKAGKCLINPIQSNGKHQITPDVRKGTVSLVKKNDQLHYLKWTDRTSNRVEDERMIFPDELKCLKVKTGRENDRIHLLKYNTGQQFLMFWMQDKSSDKDKEIHKKLNDLLHNPATATVASSSGAGGGRLGSEQLMQMLGMQMPPVPPAVATTTLSSAAANPANNLLANLDFSSLLSANQSAGQSSSSSSSSSTAAAATTTIPLSSQNNNRRQLLGLEDILTADSILDTGIMNDPEVVASLLQYLPEEQRSEAYLEETLRSAQFFESLRMLSHALQSDNFNSVMMNFNIDPAPGMQHLIRNDAIGAFIAALQATVDAQKSSESNSSSTDSNNNNNNSNEEKK